VGRHRHRSLDAGAGLRQSLNRVFSAGAARFPGGRASGGTPGNGDRLALRRSESGYRRSDEAHRAALKRLELLLHLHHSGGIYFGDNLDTQLQLCSPTDRVQAKALVTVRFCCQSWSFAFIREGLQRYPIEHTRFSKRLPGERWWHHPKAPHVLKPGSPADTHPYPVELDLPAWTVERDIDLRNWLFGFGAGIRIEAPLVLREEHQQKLLTALAVYQPA
jgi:hypothetical protein